MRKGELSQEFLSNHAIQLLSYVRQGTASTNVQQNLLQTQLRRTVTGWTRFDGAHVVHWCSVSQDVALLAAHPQLVLDPDYAAVLKAHNIPLDFGKLGIKPLTIAAFTAVLLGEEITLAKSNGKLTEYAFAFWEFAARENAQKRRLDLGKQLDDLELLVDNHGVTQLCRDAHEYFRGDALDPELLHELGLHKLHERCPFAGSVCDIPESTQGARMAELLLRKQYRIRPMQSRVTKKIHSYFEQHGGPDVKDKVLKLPIFEKLGGAAFSASAEGRWALAESHKVNLPRSLEYDAVFVSDELGKKLGAVLASPAQFLAHLMQEEIWFTFDSATRADVTEVLFGNALYDTRLPSTTPRTPSSPTGTSITLVPCTLPRSAWTTRRLDTSE
jgi:hypothetical protein